jgi:hypothetical protein
MIDSEIRGIILSSLYETRHRQQYVHIPDDLQIVGFDLTNKQDLTVLGNVAQQLADQNLITLERLIGSHPNGLAKITAFGVDVIEQKSQSPISITIDQRISVTGSSHVQIGSGNVQNVSDFDKLNLAVEKSNATQAEEEEAKSLLEKLSKSPLVLAILKKIRSKRQLT